MKKTALVLCAVLLMAVNGYAQLDPDDDGIGVYFDPCACVNCISMDMGIQTAFLVITHPTSPQGVGGWECKMWVDGPAFMTNVALQGQAINAGTRPGEFIVGTADPQINPFTYPAIVVAELTFFIEDVAAPVNWWIDSILQHSHDEPVPAYLDGSDPNIVKKLQQATGGPQYPVATVNGDCAVSTEAETWGGVKALFR